MVTSVNGTTRAATLDQILKCTTNTSVANPSSGLLPTRSMRRPNPHRHTAHTALHNTIIPKINESVAANESRSSGIQNTPPPACPAKNTALYTSNFRNGGYRSISP